jgi:hypothetical protein
MSDQRITQLTALPKAAIDRNDVLPIVDLSASETKKVTAQDLVDAGLDLVADSSIDLAKLDQASTTKLGTTALANNAVTYAKVQNVTATDRLLGRSSAGSGGVEEIVCTAAGRALLDDADAAAQRATLGLGNLATNNGTFSGTHSGTTSGVNTGDQTITLTGPVTGTGTGSFATTITNGAVTYAKIQNTTGTDVLLGRSSAGGGTIQEIACTPAGRALIDDATVADQRNTLGLGTIATQAAGSVAITGGTLTGVSITSGSATITGGTISGISSLAIADGGTGANTAAIARTNLGLTIGTNVQAYDPALQSIAGLVTGADQFLYTTGADTYTAGNLTAAGRALLDDTDATAQRATLGLGTLAVQSGTFSGTHSGTSSGTNTGDQTITLTGEVTGSGTGSFAATIASGAITEAKLASNAVTTAKLLEGSVTAAKLANNSAAVVASAVPSGAGAFIGQQWINTNTAIEYTWDGTSWVRQASLGAVLLFSENTPLTFAVTYPDPYTASVSVNLDTQAANRVWAGPISGVDAAPTFRTLQPSDLPNATASTKGVVQPGTGLSVTSGTLNHSNSTTAGTFTKLTVDAQGHVSAGTTLSTSDIPELDASKVTSGTFATARIADDAITGLKLANYSTAKVGEALPTADYIGQIFLNPLDKAFFMWDGNVWQPIGISAGSVIFAGTYNATTNRIATVTTEGTAIGLSVGNPLPTASNLNESYYVVVSTGGTGTSPAPAVSLAPPDLILSNGSNWVEIDVSSTYVAQTASNVGFTPAANLGSTNVQAALEEVSSECRNADNITSGTLLATRGGTGTGSYTKGDLLAASSGTALSKLAVGTNGQVLRANSSTATGLEWGTDFVGTVTSVTGSGAISVTNGTTTPAISVTAASTSTAGVVQLSDSISTSSSVLAATATAVKSSYDLANAALPKAGGTMTGPLELGAGVSIIFEGATGDAFETVLTCADPTADQQITLPNLTGTVALTSQLDDGTY